MSVNKFLRSAKPSRFLQTGGFLLILLGAASPSLAQTAPALSNVGEMSVQNTHLSNPEEAKACGLSEQKISEALTKQLKGYGAPATSAVEAKPAQLGSARVDIVTDVSTHSNQGLDCTSYVQVSAQTKDMLEIPPIKIRRSVTVTYWQNGLIVSSVSSAHERVIQDALEKLARALAERYKADQPPDLSGLITP